MFGPSARPDLPAGLDRRQRLEARRASRRSQSPLDLCASPSATCAIRCWTCSTMPDMHNSCPQRSTTTTAPQALTLLNGEFSLEQARRWSGTVAGRTWRRYGRAGAHGLDRGALRASQMTTSCERPLSVSRSTNGRDQPPAAPRPAMRCRCRCRRPRPGPGGGRWSIFATRFSTPTNFCTSIDALTRLPTDVDHLPAADRLCRTSRLAVSRRDFLARAGAGFGSVALAALLARDTSRPCRRGGPARVTSARRQSHFPAHGQERHLVLPRRRAQPHRPVRSQARARQAGRQAAAR